MKPVAFSPRLFRVILIAILIALVILYIAQTLISQSKKTLLEDFIIFYTAGTIARTEGLANVYDLPRQLEAQRQILNRDLTPHTMLVYNHLPFLIPIFYVLTHLNYGLAGLLWRLFLFTLYAVSIACLLKMTAPFHHQPRPLLAAAIGLFYPIYVSLYHGQDTAFLFLGLTLWYVGQEKKQETLSILGLILTTFRPHVSAGLLLTYTVTHPKQFWKIIVGGTLWAMLNMTIVGLQGTIDFFRILTLSAKGLQLRMSDSAMLNLLGLLTRLFDSAPVPLLRSISWGGFFLGILFAIWVWKLPNQTPAWKMSMNIIIALCFAPHLHYHDLSIAAIPLVFALSQNRTVTQKSLLTGVLPIFSLITLLTPAWYHLWPYTLYGFLTVYLLRNRLSFQHQA